MRLSLFLAFMLPACVHAAAGSACVNEPVNSTEHRIQLDGTPLNYTAEVGRVAIRDVETGQPHGYMFYTAYRAESPDGPRPLTFVWNGGPGANSALLHFEIAGPKRLENGDFIDNADTWLKVSDLVFVDPIGTGFSRPVKPEYAEEFYSTPGDVASVTEFVRAWRLLHEAEDNPLYLAGESWGAGRAGSVGYALEKRGIRVSGLVLISGGTGLHGDFMDPELARALHVADLSATGLYHGRVAIDPDSDAAALRDAAEAWARQLYAPALARVDELSDEERNAVIDRLAYFTGMPADRIDRERISITPREYLNGLLSRQDEVLNTFDMRIIGQAGGGDESVIYGYLRRELGYLTDLPYLGLEGMEQGYAPSGVYPPSVNERWNYATVPMSPEETEAAYRAAAESGSGPPQLGPPLPSTAEAVALNPDLKILVAAGLFDSLNSCARNAELSQRLPAELQNAFLFRCYEGGHMMYRDPEARVRLSRDIAGLVSGTR